MSRDPFECWYTFAEAASRLGVHPRTVKRLVEADAGLRSAARIFCGEMRIPWSAWERWLAGRPAGAWSPRVVTERDGGGRFLGNPVVGRTEGEARRKLEILNVDGNENCLVGGHQ